jgi:hypothetical protein
MKFVLVILKALLSSKWRIAIVTVEQFSFVVNPTNMCFKVSFHTKGTIANLAFMWLQFFMNQLDVLFEMIFSFKTFFTDVTVAHFLTIERLAKKYGYSHKAISNTTVVNNGQYVLIGLNLIFNSGDISLHKLL